MHNMKHLIPSFISLLRILCAPLFYFVFLNSTCLASFIIFIFAALTDIADGITARKLSVSSKFGAYADVFSDFILIIAVFLAFTQKHWYCIFIFIPIGASFVNFLISSGIKEPVYDPLGKYTGAIIMLIIVITLLIPHVIIRKICTYTLSLYFIIRTVYRIYYLKKHKRQALKSV